MNRVDTLHKLACYLAYTAKKLSKSCITHYLQQTHGYWKLRFTARSQLTKEKARMYAKAYPAILIELWLYSLGKIIPLLQNNKNTDSLYFDIAVLLEQQLKTQPQLDKYIDLEQATNNFLQLLQQTDFTKEYGFNPSAMLMQHLGALIDTQPTDGSSISGHLRSHTMQFTRDWNETVITEAIIKRINKQPESQQKARQETTQNMLDASNSHRNHTETRARSTQEINNATNP